MHLTVIEIRREAIRQLEARENELRRERDEIQRQITLCCQQRQRLEALVNGQTTVEEQIAEAEAV